MCTCLHESVSSALERDRNGERKGNTNGELLRENISAEVAVTLTSICPHIRTYPYKYTALLAKSAFLCKYSAIVRCHVLRRKGSERKQKRHTATSSEWMARIYATQSQCIFVWLFFNYKDILPFLPSFLLPRIHSALVYCSRSFPHSICFIFAVPSARLYSVRPLPPRSCFFFWMASVQTYPSSLHTIFLCVYDFWFDSLILFSFSCGNFNWTSLSFRRVKVFLCSLTFSHVYDLCFAIYNIIATANLIMQQLLAYAHMYAIPCV